MLPGSESQLYPGSGGYTLFRINLADSVGGGKTRTIKIFVIAYANMSWHLCERVVAHISVRHTVWYGHVMRSFCTERTNEAETVRKREQA